MNNTRSKKFLTLIIQAAIVFIIICALPGVASEKTMQGDTTKHTKRVIFIGASIGKGWDLPGLPERVGINDYIFETYAVYQFDKTDILRKVLSRQEDLPDIVIIKECAVYFPGNIQEQRALVISWVEMCRSKGVQAMLATTVPVVQGFPLRVFLLSLLRLKLAWPGEKFNSVIEYNDWLREYAATEGIHVLDLEAALSSGPNKRYLKNEYAKVDGLHINEKAYKELDSFLIKSLLELGKGKQDK